MFNILYIFARDSTLLSLPIIRRLRNKVYEKYLNAEDINIASRVVIECSHTSCDTFLKIEPGLRVGQDVKIDTTGGISVGKEVTISEGVKVYTHDHIIDGSNENWRSLGVKCSSLHISDYAWIGANSVVTNSVNRIGKGAVIASGSVVTSDVDDFSIVAGVPAKHIRFRLIHPHE